MEIPILCTYMMGRENGNAPGRNIDHRGWILCAY